MIGDNMVRIGIVGTNFISEWFMAGARRTGGRVDPVAVYSRSADRAEAFAKQEGIARGFGDFGAMLDAVDAVYIASPTIAHHPQAMSAINAGKHVLVEKTITTSYAQAEEIFQAAEEQGVVAMEAMRHLHTPDYALIQEAIARIGTVRYAHIEMLQYSSRYDRFRAGEILNAFNPALGNAAIVDIGVYCLEPTIDLFGVPLSHTGHSVHLHNGFEGGGSIQFDYGSMIADVTYSKIIKGITPATIIGEDGAVTVNLIGETSLIELHGRQGTETLLDIPAVHPSDGMHHELAAFADQVDAGTMDPRWRNVTLNTRRIMDEHLARVGEGDVSEGCSMRAGDRS